MDSDNYLYKCDFAVDMYIFADGSKKYLIDPYPTKYQAKFPLTFFDKTSGVTNQDANHDDVIGYNTKIRRSVLFTGYSWWSVNTSTPSRTIHQPLWFSPITIRGSSSSGTYYTAMFSFDNPIDLPESGNAYDIAKDSSGTHYYYKIKSGGKLISGNITTIVPVSFVKVSP